MKALTLNQIGKLTSRFESWSAYHFIL